MTIVVLEVAVTPTILPSSHPLLYFLMEESNVFPIRQQAPRLRRHGTSEEGILRPRTELSREKDVYKYLHTWTSLHQPAVIHRHAFPNDDEPLQTPEPGGDTALAAFAQLSALRLNARRALITLISSGTEYVLAEATRTMSLQYDTVVDKMDAPWLGCCSFPRTDGLNDVAVEAWRKARRYRDLPGDTKHYYQEGRSAHWFILSDAMNSSEFRERAFLQRAPCLRFFCSIPLRDSHGSVIGALSLMDDEPRFGVSATDMLLLEDSADTITSHLDSLVIRSRQQRSERLIQALGPFNNKMSSLRDWWIGHEDQQSKQAGRYHHKEVNIDGQRKKMEAEFGLQESPDHKSAAAERRTKRQHSNEKAAGTPEAYTTPTTERNANAANAREQQGISGSDFDPRPTAPKLTEPGFAGTQSNQSAEQDEAAQQK